MNGRSAEFAPKTVASGPAFMTGADEHETQLQSVDVISRRPLDSSAHGHRGSRQIVPLLLLVLVLAGKVRAASLHAL